MLIRIQLLANLCSQLLDAIGIQRLRACRAVASMSLGSLFSMQSHCTMLLTPMQAINITSVEAWGLWQRVEDACRTTHLLQGLVRQRYAASQALQEGRGVLVLLRICWHALQGALHVVRDAQQAAHELLHGRPQC